MSLESEIENQLFAVRRVVLASGWRQGLTSLFTMLRPLSCLTMFCDHNFSLVSRFDLQFSQNYVNIDTDKIQH